MKKVPPEPGALRAALWDSVRQLVRLVMLGVWPRMNASCAQAGVLHCYPRRVFGLYGFDIMLTRQGAPKLIEVNSSPATGTSTQVDVDIKFEMLRDVLHLVSPVCYLDGGERIIYPERNTAEEV